MEVGYIPFTNFPDQVSLSGLTIDADRNVSLVIPEADGDWKTAEYMTITGYASSALEHFIWERKYEPGGVSAVKAIQTAYEAGVTVTEVSLESNPDDYEEVIDGFTLAEAAEADMKAAVRSGMTVKTPVDEVSIGSWTGVGYFKQWPNGAGAFKIVPEELSGGFYFMPANVPSDKYALLIKERTIKQPYVFWLYHHIWLVARDVRCLGYNVVYGCPTSKQIVIELLSSTIFQIFYYYGHGDWDHIVLIDWTVFGEEGEIEEKKHESLSNDEVPAIDPNQYKIVFINSCNIASTNVWAEAFCIDTTVQGTHNEAFIGPDRETPAPTGASFWGQRFWDYLADNSNTTVYDAIWYPDDEPPESGWWLCRPPYGPTGQEWFNPTEPYWDFRR